MQKPSLHDWIGHHFLLRHVCVRIFPVIVVPEVSFLRCVQPPVPCLAVFWRPHPGFDVSDGGICQSHISGERLHSASLAGCSGVRTPALPRYPMTRTESSESLGLRPHAGEQTLCSFQVLDCVSSSPACRRVSVMPMPPGISKWCFTLCGEPWRLMQSGSHPLRRSPGFCVDHLGPMQCLQRTSYSSPPAFLVPVSFQVPVRWDLQNTSRFMVVHELPLVLFLI